MSIATVLFLEITDLEALVERPVPPAIELRHNDEPLGRVCAGAIQVDHDGVQSDARFWLGLKALRASLSVCAVREKDVHA